MKLLGCVTGTTFKFQALGQVHLNSGLGHDFFCGAPAVSSGLHSGEVTLIVI